MNVASIIALTILISLLQIGCSPVKVSLNSEFGLSLGKTPSEDQPKATAEISITSQPPFINTANSDTFTLDGSCTNLEEIRITINDTILYKVNCVAGHWQATLDASSEPDGDVIINFVDPESMQSLKTVTLQKDVAWPIALLDYTIPALNNSPSTLVSITEMIGSVQFSYKLGDAASTDCTSPTGYSTYMTAESDAVVNLFSDGNYRLCLIGKDSFENEQPYDNATVINWQLDTVMPNLTLSSATSTNFINIATKNSFSIAVSCSEIDQSVKFVAIDKNLLEYTATTTCVAGNTASIILNLGTLADGIVRIWGSHLDAAGNVLPAFSMLALVKDTQAPNITASINDGNYYASVNTSPAISWSSATDTGGSGISSYELGFGTGLTTPNLVPFYSVGLNLTAQKSFGSPLTEGTMYYAFVKVYDLAGNSTTIVSDGWKPDTTAPTVPGMNDGVYSAAGQTPAMVWSSGSDGTGSGILRYEVAVGTSAGANDIVDWVSVGSSNVATTNSVDINLGSTYFGSVRAVDNAGNVGVAKIGDGFYIKPVVVSSSVVSNSGAFAAIMTNGKVVCWGDSAYGGDFSSLPSALKTGPLSVTKLVSNTYAFAAIMSDGSVLTWGSPSYGGDSSSVAASLDGTIDVSSITGTQSAFAAKRVDGSVIIWGMGSYGGIASAGVTSSLNGSVPVVSIHSTASAFAALRSDGSVIAWGYNGGDTSAVSSDINGTNPVNAIYSTSGVFIAKRVDGSLITWGSNSTGVLPSAVANDINGTIPVITVTTNPTSVAALRTDGSVITWGHSLWGGDSSAAASQINGSNKVVKVFSNSSAFAALREDGSVVAWGVSNAGGDTSSVASELTGSPLKVTNIAKTSAAFAAIRDNGSAIIWGLSGYGGVLGVLPASAINGSNPVTSITGNHAAFAAIRADGSLVAWGSAANGGDTGSVASKLDGVTYDVVAVHYNNFAFAAVLSNGHIVTWGDNTYGGDSSAVNP